MKTNLTTRRLLEGLALFLIGDGVMGLLKPRRRSLLWDCGPEFLREFTEMLAEHRPLARGIYVAEIALGLLVASKQTAEELD
jgi:hypothetical protein